MTLKRRSNRQLSGPPALRLSGPTARQLGGPTSRQLSGPTARQTNGPTALCGPTARDLNGPTARQLSGPTAPTPPALLFALLFGLALFSLFPSPATAQDQNHFGMDIHSPAGDDLVRVMNKVQAAGIGWVHVAMIWPWVEATPGVYDWSLYDSIVAAAQARNIKILATILYTPAWATKDPTWTGVPDSAAWASFCSQAARRYAGSIHYWGLWNEPNLTEFWTGSRGQYINGLLVPGADAIHAASPGAKVGGPALAHLGSARWYDWLNEVIAKAGDRLDFVTHHVYDQSGNRQVTSKLTDSTTFGDVPGFWSFETPSVREVLRYAGWFGKPFWLTETGWQSGQIGEAQQANYYAGMLDDWFTGRQGQSWIDKIFFYEMEDPSWDNHPTWGILNPDGTPKMVYYAYRDFIAGRQGGGATDNAQLLAADIPASMDAGQTVTVRLTFRNNGTSTWTPGAYELGAVGDSDPFAAPRAPLASGESIAPGQQKTFSFAFTAPASPGSYASRWRMLRDGGASFGDELSRQVVVRQAPAASERTLALLGGRFAVEVSWHDLQSGNAGFGRAIPGSDETGTFWFFSPVNVELVIKALDGRALNNHFWFFYGALSDVEYWITATDRVTGAVATYHNPSGNLCGKGDTSAFAASAASAASAAASSEMAFAPLGETPAPAATPRRQGVGRWVSLPLPATAQPTALDLPNSSATPSCVASAQDLCLLGNRFDVHVTWRTGDGATGTGTAAALGDQSGTFAFFDPRAVDLVVKVLDGRSLTGKFWFFYGALSDVRYDIFVTDTVTGSSQHYRNRQGNLCGRGDTAALD